MKKLYFLIISVFFFSVSIVAQDYKWSVEANYPLSIGDQLGNDVSGIVDIGVKYRFLDFNIVKIGAGINAGVFEGNFRSFDGFNGELDSFDIDETNWLIQPKIFAEFSIPGVSKLHPSIGLGYAFVESKYKGIVQDESFNYTYSEGGFNANVGLSYDITKRFFLQVQYDYARTKDDNINTDVKRNLGFLKFGAGFRF